MMKVIITKEEIERTEKLIAITPINKLISALSGLSTGEISRRLEKVGELSHMATPCLDENHVNKNK